MNNKGAVNQQENKMEIAETILEQLGGKMFVMMTGARELVGSDCAGMGAGIRGTLRFRISRRIVVIRLTDADDYTMTIYAARGNKIVSERTGLYCDTLRAAFETETGLVTTLGTMTSLPVAA